MKFRAGVLWSNVSKLPDILVTFWMELEVYTQSWKDHCWSDLAREREVTLVPPLHCVITVGAAALWLFLTGCDTDGFDHRDSQSQGPRRVEGRGSRWADEEEGSFWERKEDVRWSGLGPFLLQGWYLKQTEKKNLNKDGSHQTERIFYLIYYRIHGMKVTLPSWSSVANAITGGTCPGWVFHVAQCLQMCRSFGYKVGICHCVVCAMCHMLHLSAGFIVRLLPESHVIPSNMCPGSLIGNSR